MRVLARVVEAFCGPGGLALGIRSAIEAIGGSSEFAAILDTDTSALDIHRRNFGAHRALSSNVASMVDFHVLKLAIRPLSGTSPRSCIPELAKFATSTCS